MVAIGFFAVIAAIKANSMMRDRCSLFSCFLDQLSRVSIKDVTSARGRLARRVKRRWRCLMLSGSDVLINTPLSKNS